MYIMLTQTVVDVQDRLLLEEDLGQEVEVVVDAFGLFTPQ